MNDPVVRRAQPADEPGTLFPLALLSMLVGVASGLIGALFRLSLEHADGWRNAFLIWAHGWNIAGLLLVMAVCAVATGLAAWLVRRWAPLASGSGIPHVECVLNDLLPPVPFRLIPVKFVGGVLAMGSGLALGREGPSVQMGASVAHLVAKLFRRKWVDCRVLMAAGAGSGVGDCIQRPDCRLSIRARRITLRPFRYPHDHRHFRRASVSAHLDKPAVAWVRTRLFGRREFRLTAGSCHCPFTCCWERWPADWESSTTERSCLP